MLKIAVCDDDEKICNLLENYINDSCRILHIEAETESFISGKVLKRKLREGENYQIYFLDIELADDTGISVSDCIRNEIKDEAAQIVYVSGKDGYDRQLFAFYPFMYCYLCSFFHCFSKYNILFVLGHSCYYYTT